VHAPLHPAKVDVAVGLAVSVTTGSDVVRGYDALQVPGQLIAPVPSVTVPEPIPLVATRRLGKSSPVPVIVADGGPPLMFSVAPLAPYVAGSNFTITSHDCEPASGLPVHSSEVIAISLVAVPEPRTSDVVSAALATLPLFVTTKVSVGPASVPAVVVGNA
jgi:hypothetical protein